MLYGTVMLTGPTRKASSRNSRASSTQYQPKVSDALASLKSGSLEALNRTGGLPGIILGSKLAADTGMILNGKVTLYSSRGLSLPSATAPPCSAS